MSLQKRVLFHILHSEHLSIKKFKAVESYVFDNIIDVELYNEVQVIAIRKKLAIF